MSIVQKAPEKQTRHPSTCKDTYCDQLSVTWHHASQEEACGEFCLKRTDCLSQWDVLLSQETSKEPRRWLWPPCVPYRDKALSMGPRSRCQPDCRHSWHRLGNPYSQTGSDCIFLLHSLVCMDTDLATSLGRKEWQWPNRKAEKVYSRH